MKQGISIIIPTYNREKLIEEAIQSVLDQDYNGKLEIIISDDGSSDKTIDKVKLFGKQVRILLKPETCTTQGAAASRNRGIKASTQPFLCFLDSDDFYLPGHLNSMALFFEENPNFDFAFCRTIEVKEVKEKKFYKPWTHRYILKNDIANPVVSRDKVVHTNSLMFKKNIFNRIGYFNESYSNGEDIDMWMRISEQFKGGFTNHYGAAYRKQHGADQLTKNLENKIDENVLSVLNGGLSRYKCLGLSDVNRLFELKHLLLHRLYNKHKLIYLFKYLSLISQYPICFLRRIQIFYYELLEQKDRQGWKDLNLYEEMN